jgi:hypothetical protein
MSGVLRVPHKRQVGVKHESEIRAWHVRRARSPRGQGRAVTR